MVEENGIEAWEELESDQERIARLEERLRAHIRVCEIAKTTRRWVITMGVTILVALISLLSLLINHMDQENERHHSPNAFQGESWSGGGRD